MRLRISLFLFVSLGFAALTPSLHAWGEEGHRMVNQLALAALPKDFPDFVRVPANAERIVFLANVPDRWRSVDPYLRQSGGSWVDHFLDVEQLPAAGIDPKTVPSLRYDFVLLFAASRVAHADKLPVVDPATDSDHTKEWPGFAPWAIAEWYHRLRAAFGYLKAYEEVGGTPEEIANAKADAMYAMGIMGHYVGDCAQPLHTTVHHDGWVGANPNGYVTTKGIHPWIDGTLIRKAEVKVADLLPRVKTPEAISVAPRTDGRDPLFVAVMDYILAQNEKVEPLYKMEKDHLLGMGDQPVAPEGRAFVEGQLLIGSEMLARIWMTAWQSAPVDSYLRTSLGRRFAPAGGGAPVKKGP